MQLTSKREHVNANEFFEDGVIANRIPTTHDIDRNLFVIPDFDRDRPSRFEGGRRATSAYEASGLAPEREDVIRRSVATLLRNDVEPEGSRQQHVDEPLTGSAPIDLSRVVPEVRNEPLPGFTGTMRYVDGGMVRSAQTRLPAIEPVEAWPVSGGVIQGVPFGVATSREHVDESRGYSIEHREVAPTPEAFSNERRIAAVTETSFGERVYGHMGAPILGVSDKPLQYPTRDSLFEQKPESETRTLQGASVHMTRSNVPSAHVSSRTTGNYVLSPTPVPVLSRVFHAANGRNGVSNLRKVAQTASTNRSLDTCLQSATDTRLTSMTTIKHEDKYRASGQPVGPNMAGSRTGVFSFSSDHAQMPETRLARTLTRIAPDSSHAIVSLKDVSLSADALQGQSLVQFQNQTLRNKMEVRERSDESVNMKGSNVQGLPTRGNQGLEGKSTVLKADPYEFTRHSVPLPGPGNPPPGTAFTESMKNTFNHVWSGVKSLFQKVGALEQEATSNREDDRQAPRPIHVHRATMHTSDPSVRTSQKRVNEYGSFNEGSAKMQAPSGFQVGNIQTTSKDEIDISERRPGSNRVLG